jgi:uncharacterized protein with GYD domain
MPHYIILGNFTKKGIENIEDAPKRDEAARSIIEEAGGSLQLFYTMGDYDFVAITEMPDDDSMLKFLLQTLRGKKVVMKTLKAWTDQEFGELVSGLGEE